MSTVLARSALVVLAAASLGACKFERTADLKPADAPVDPGVNIPRDFPARILPYLEQHAAPLSDQLAALAADPAAAKAKYGTPKPGAGVFVASFEGKVLTADTAARAGTLAIDANGDGAPDALVLVGPTIPGTVIRDALPFVAYGDFPSQVEYARYGRALNEHIDKTILSRLPRDHLAGATVKGLGVFSTKGPAGAVRIAPVQLAVEPANVP